MGFIRQLTGKDKAKAIERAKDKQVAAAIGASARDQLLGNVLAPLQNPDLPQLQSAQDVINNPFFQALNAQSERDNLARNAALGLAGSGGTQDALTRNLLLLGNQFQQQDFSNQQQDFINQNANLQNTLATNQQRFNQLLNVTNLGSNALTNQANLITGRGNAQAAGLVGQANAKSAAAGNIFNLGTQAIGAGLGAFGGLGAAGASGATIGAGVPVGQQVFGLNTGGAGTFVL